MLRDILLSVPGLFCPVTISSVFSLWRCRGVCSGTISPLFLAIEKPVYVLRFLILGQWGDALDAGYSPLGRITESSGSFRSTLPFPSFSYQLPVSNFLQFTVEGHFELWGFNPFLPRSGRVSDLLHVGSTCMLFIRISSSIRLGKTLLFKALGGSKHY